VILPLISAFEGVAIEVPPAYTLGMNTQQFERELRKEKTKLEKQLHGIAMTLEGLAHLTGKRIATATAPLKKKAFRQSANARKAMSAAKKAWWAAKKKQTKAA
jgi:hypothetical protein